MFRIILPLLLVVTLVFAPLESESFESARGGETTAERNAAELFFQSSLDCAMNQEFNPMVEECAPQNYDGKSTFQSWLFYSAASSSVLAAILGVAGLLPFVGRLTSVVTTGSGAISTAAIGTYLMDMMGQEAISIQWGAWAAAVLAVLILLSGLTGIAGRND